MFCRNCGEPLNENQAVCLKCGVSVGDGKAFCANCGAAVNEHAAVCLSCGCKIEDKKSASGSNSLNGQDKLVMALLCFFLGGWGVHNFMMGEKKKGIIKIVFAFVCGISSILALIDFIKILTDSYVAEPN